MGMLNDAPSTSDEVDQHHAKLTAPPAGPAPQMVQDLARSSRDEAGSLPPPTRGESLASGAARYGHDIERGFDAGATKGVQMIGDAPGAAVRALGRTAKWFGDKPSAGTFKRVGEALRPGEVSSPVFKTDPNYQPTTTPGAISKEVGTLAPLAVAPEAAPELAADVGAAGRIGEQGVKRALIGPGTHGPLANPLVNYAVAPGVAGEGYKQAVENTPVLEPLRKSADLVKGGIELATGGAAGLLNRGPEAVGDILRRSTKGLDPGEAQGVLDKAEQLYQANVREGRPTLTRAEAIYHASDGRIDMRTAQHLAEARGQGDITRMVEQRGREDIPASVEEAKGVLRGRETPMNRRDIGPETQAETRGAKGDIEKGIQAETQPLYRQAETQKLTPNMMQELDKNEIVRRAREEVLNDHELNATLAGHGPDSVMVNDQVRKLLRERAQTLWANGEKLKSGNVGAAADAVEATLKNATGSRGIGAPAPGAVGPTNVAAKGAYEQAQETHAALSQERLEPFMRGPGGKLYQASDASTQAMTRQLFSGDIAPQDVGDFIKRIGGRNQRLANALVEEHFADVADKAMKQTQKGANPMAGGNIVKNLAGGDRSADNFKAAVEALPNGKDTYAGFQKFVDYWGASRSRLPAQSMTAEKGEMLDEAKGVRLPPRPLKMIQKWQLGQNLDELGKLLTQPEAQMRFRQLMKEPQGSPRAARLVARLAVMAGASGSGDQYQALGNRAIGAAQSVLGR
jgi:hypothetical protein